MSRCNIKKWPSWKMTPGSFFNGKNDSPGHFSTKKLVSGDPIMCRAVATYVDLYMVKYMDNFTSLNKQS